MIVIMAKPSKIQVANELSETYYHNGVDATVRQWNDDRGTFIDIEVVRDDFASAKGAKTIPVLDASGKETGLFVTVLTDGLTGVELNQGDEPGGGIRVPEPAVKGVAKIFTALMKTAT